MSCIFKSMQILKQHINNNDNYLIIYFFHFITEKNPLFCSTLFFKRKKCFQLNLIKILVGPNLAVINNINYNCVARYRIL